jgi:DNA-3-methyladenine glycosylase I
VRLVSSGARFSFTGVLLPAKHSRPDASEPKIARCAWASNGLSISYHDKEWGVPVRRDRAWFEFLTLEGAQAGLSWDTVLKKRRRYRELFAGFDAAKVVLYGKADTARILSDPGIVRNRLKIQSTISNAQAFLQLRREFGSFNAYIWEFVGGAPIQNKWKAHRELPATTPLALRLSNDLRQRGFRFVGPTICYAMMQATGIVNDHVLSCFRYAPVARMASEFD